MSQSTYLRNVLSKFNISTCKGVTTPCDKCVVQEDSNEMSSTDYRCAVGSLIYAMVCTRRDLSWIITKLFFVIDNTI